MPKNKTPLMIIAIIVVIALIIGGFLLYKNNTSTPEPEPTPSRSDVVEELSAGEIALNLEASPDNKKIRFEIGDLTDIKAVSYELTYEAEPSAQEKADGAEQRVQRGVVGEAKLKSGDTKYISPWLDLGSCSSGVCKYDVGVTSVSLVLKITKDDGKIYQTEESLDL